MEEFAARHAASIVAFDHLTSLGYKFHPHLVPPPTRDANFQDEDKDKPSSPPPSPSKEPPAVSGMSQKLVAHIDQLKALEETKKAQDGNRTLRQEYKSMTKRAAGKRFPKTCKGAGACKNKLCEHLFAVESPLDERQNHMIDIVMKKTADNGYACERKFAEDWFKRSGQKLVQTVGAIAADIERREEKIRNSGRLRLHPTIPIQSIKNRLLTPLSSSASREEILFSIEYEDESLKLCLSQKAASPMVKDLFKRLPCQQDRKDAFASYVGEARFREARAEYWRECRGKGVEGDKLLDLMDRWELEHDDDPEFRAAGWRTPFTDAYADYHDDTEDVAEAQTPYQATVEDADEDEDDYDDGNGNDNVEDDGMIDPEATLVIRNVARRLLETKDRLLTSLAMGIYKGVFYGEDILSHHLITDEDAVYMNKKSTTHDEKLLRVWRRYQESEFPELSRDDGRVDTMFDALRKWLLKIFSQDNFCQAMKESHVLSAAETTAFLGLHSSPAQRKLLFIQRYYQLLPPLSQENMLILKYQLEAVEDELQTEFRGGEIKYHDPSKYMPPSDHVIVDLYFRHADLTLTPEEMNDVMTGGILTNGLAERILGPDANGEQKKILFWARYLEKYPEVSTEQLEGIVQRVDTLARDSDEIKYLENLATTLPTSSKEYDRLKKLIINLPNNPSTIKAMYRMLRKNIESPEAVQMMDNLAHEKLLLEITSIESMFERDHGTNAFVEEAAHEINDMIYAVANQFSIIDNETKQVKDFDAGKDLWDGFEPEDGIGLMTFDEAFDQYATAKIMQALPKRSKKWAALTEKVRLYTSGLVRGFELLYPEEALVKGHIEIEVDVKDTSAPERTVDEVIVNSSSQKGVDDSTDSTDSSNKNDVEDREVMTPESGSDDVDVTSGDHNNPGEWSSEGGVHKTNNKGKGFIKAVSNAVRNMTGPRDTLFKMIATKNIDKKLKKLKKLEAEGIGAGTPEKNSFDAQVGRGVTATGQSDLEGFAVEGDQAGCDITEGHLSDDENGEDDEDSAESNQAVMNTDDNQKEYSAEEKVKTASRVPIKGVTAGGNEALPEEVCAIQASEYDSIKTLPRGRFRGMNTTQIAALVNKDLNAHSMKLNPIIRIFFANFLKLHAAITIGDALSTGPFKSDQIAYFMAKTRANSIYTAINVFGICGNKPEQAIALYIYMTSYLVQYFRHVGVRMIGGGDAERDLEGDMEVTQQMVEIMVWEFAEYVWERRKIMVKPYSE